MSAAPARRPNTHHTATTRERLERELAHVQDRLRHYREQTPNSEELALKDDYWNLRALERTLQRVLRVGPFDDGYLGNLLDEVEALPTADGRRRTRSEPHWD